MVRVMSRRTKVDMAVIREAMVAELATDHPQTLRGLFYRLVSRGVVAKTEKEYKGTVCRLSAEMRRSGDVPYHWLADPTRWMRKPITFSSAEDALRRTAETYRRALWDDAETVPEVWCEKDAISGVLAKETAGWDVPLMPCRGYPSLSFLYSAAEVIKERHEVRDQHTVIYYFGDHDPSGVEIDQSLVRGIGECLISMDPHLEVLEFEPEDAFEEMASFERVAVTPAQIVGLNLQTRPTKRNPRDHRAKRFAGDSVEVDAIPARHLRAIAAACIEQHVDQDALELLRVVEAEERAGLMALVIPHRDGDA
jgi:hypothetical protein